MCYTHQSEARKHIILTNEKLESIVIYPVRDTNQLTVLSRYDHDTCKALCNQLTDVIKDEVRRDIRDIERYKLVCWVSIGQVSL